MAASSQKKKKKAARRARERESEQDRNHNLLQSNFRNDILSFRCILFIRNKSLGPVHTRREYEAQEYES